MVFADTLRSIYASLDKIHRELIAGDVERSKDYFPYESLNVATPEGGYLTKFPRQGKFSSRVQHEEHLVN